MPLPSMLLGWPTPKVARFCSLVFAVLLVFWVFSPIERVSSWPSPWSSSSSSPRPDHGADGTAKPTASLPEDTLQYFVDSPLTPPYKHVFGELGRRTRILCNWLAWADSNPSDLADVNNSIEEAAMALYPFLRSPPPNPESRTPLADLRSTFAAGSAGLVIPSGDGNIRYAAHLIGALRSVLGSSLPIEIAYAGDNDLSPAMRALLNDKFGSGGSATLDFVDVTAVFDDSTLRFREANGGWAVKAFAALASRFEKVILIDADAVFLQPPEVLLPLLSPSEPSAGAFLFHDRLLWQHAFRERHDWWKEEIRHPSATLNKSLVWTEDYAEEGDSGVVVLDKSRVDVLTGLLHICWQNTYDVRDEITYKITYGDKESWWFGFELAGTPYDMEKHYGGIIGWEPAGDGENKQQPGKTPKKPRVCSFVIAHVDEGDHLLWYNGGLLKNKLRSDVEYEVPQKWMLDGDWEKGATKADMSCMAGGSVRSLTAEETDVLSQSIEIARTLDADFHKIH